MSAATTLPPIEGEQPMDPEKSASAEPVFGTPTAEEILTAKASQKRFFEELARMPYRDTAKPAPAATFTEADAAAMITAYRNENPKTGECACGEDTYRGHQRCHECEDRFQTKRQERNRAVYIAEQSMPKGFEFTRRKGFADPVVRACVKDPSALAKAQEHALDAEWMLLRGPAGLGKSVSAATVAWECIYAGIPAVWISAIRMASAVQRASLGDEPAEVHDAIQTKVAVIDDLGSEPVIASSPLLEIIHARHEAGRRTIVTTWLDGAGLKSRYGDGVARRLIERACVVDFKPKGGK